MDLYSSKIKLTFQYFTMKKIYCIALISISVFSMMYIGCKPIKDIPSEKPNVILTNSKGERAHAFAPMDVVYGSFSNLKPDQLYRVIIHRSDGSNITDVELRSNGQGVIPTSALWWDIGTEYTESRSGILNLSNLYEHRYTCILHRAEDVVAELPIRILEMAESGPIVFSCDLEGNPLNGFIQDREGIFVRGINFPPGAMVNLYAVEAQYSWESGDAFETINREPIQIQLDEEQSEFISLVADPGLMEIGTYDIVAEYTGDIGRLDRWDLIDRFGAPGFTIFNFSPPATHIAEDLACQSPPQDIYGNVIGAPNPVYKDVFSGNEEVWVAVNPKAGGGNYVGQSARLYVVHHKLATGWKDGSVLTDVSSDGFNTTVIQPGCANVNYNRVWTNPSVNDYDVIVDFAPFGVYNLGKDIIDQLNPKGFVVPAQWISLESVSFNYTTTTNTNDAINIRIDKNEDVITPEWQKNKKTYPAAYIKSKSVLIQAVFSASPGVQSATIKADKGSGQLSEINPKNVTFNGGTSGPVNFILKDPIPNKILLFNQIWKWYATKINGANSNIHLANSKNKMYVVLAQPPSPWTTSGQTEPWTKVLQRSCVWAYGKTTIVDAAEQVQHHVYDDLGGSYVYVSKYTYGTNQDFKMTMFLNNINNIGYVNCYDMGKTLVSFGNVLGCNLTYKFSAPFDSLNCEKAIGKDWKCTEWFSNHAFGSIGNNVFDACLTVDTDSDPTKSPYKNTWMTNIPWNDYNKKVTKHNSAGAPTQYNFSIK